jgi:hypothetical protein
VAGRIRTPFSAFIGCQFSYSGSVQVSLFLVEDPFRARSIEAIRLPSLRGATIRIQSASGLRDRRGAIHAGCFPRERRIAFDCSRSEFPRIFVHEVFHFVWLRAGNPLRLAWESEMRQEHRARARGELGWSAEWRRRELSAEEVEERSRRWREYCCESFCDTAAWLYSGVRGHGEFTLAARFRARRRKWFRTAFAERELPV